MARNASIGPDAGRSSEVAQAVPERRAGRDRLRLTLDPGGGRIVPTERDLLAAGGPAIVLGPEEQPPRPPEVALVEPAVRLRDDPVGRESPIACGDVVIDEFQLLEEPPDVSEIESLLEDVEGELEVSGDERSSRY